MDRLPFEVLRNLRIFSVKAHIKPDDPLFIVFSLRLDNDTHVWLQCKYERNFIMCVCVCVCVCVFLMGALYIK